MIIAEQMTEAVHREVDELVDQRSLARLCLATRVWDRDDDVAEQRRVAQKRLALVLRERQDIGRVIFVRVLEVQLMNRRVVDQRQIDGRAALPRGCHRTRQLLDQVRALRRLRRATTAIDK